MPRRTQAAIRASGGTAQYLFHSFSIKNVKRDILSNLSIKFFFHKLKNICLRADSDLKLKNIFCKLYSHSEKELR